MPLKLDDIETFKKHRNEVSESLTNKFIGRKKEVDDICKLLCLRDFVAISGSSGIGKSRLAVAAIEKYTSVHKNVTVLCVKSFGDYISAIEESIDDAKEYLFLIDDANNFKKFDELMECLKYHKQGHVKAIFTIRDYLKGCINETLVTFYEIGALNDEEIKKAIEENYLIKNDEWLNQIVKISKGNIRLASIVSDVALNSENGFASLFNTKDIINAFYKNQIVKIGSSNNLLITAGIISFFKSVYLKQLFYISPILKIVGISKQEFLHNVDTLISMEIVDECVGVVKVSDQCFADYLLTYVFIEKKYVKIKNLVVSTYKYYKKRIIESMNTILSTSLAEESISYLRNEILDSCSLIEDVGLRHDMEVAFAPLVLNQAVMEFKKGVEDFTDKKDIEWLLGLFRALAKSEYYPVANDGIIRLLKKTDIKKTNVFKTICETYCLDYGSVKSSFKYLESFVTCLTNNDIRDEHFLPLVSSYLKYSFNDSNFVEDKKLEFCSFNVNDGMDGIIPFRRKCWNYIFNYGIDKILDVIIKFARYHIIDDAQKIVRADLESVNEYLNSLEIKELVWTVLYEEFKDDAKRYNFEEMMFLSIKYSGILSLILERKPHNQSFEEFQKAHEENVRNFYSANKSSIFETLKDIDAISRYYSQEIISFLLIILDCLDEFPPFVLDMFIQYNVNPRLVVEKASTIIELNDLYAEIKSIANKSAKDEYLYSFYSFINGQGEKCVYEFSTWVKSKQDLKIASTFGRSALSLRQIAENSGISYINLLKIIFKKRKYNKSIVKEYLSYLFFKSGTFKELLDLDKDLAIKIYEFLIACKENDYKNRALKEIISVKRNYIKTFAKFYNGNCMINEDGIEEIVFDGNNCKLFFDTCIEIGKRKISCFVPFNLQRLVALNLEKQVMLDWILCYIDKNWKDNESMECLFSILAGINDNYRNSFIVKYYEKGKNANILMRALLCKCESYSPSLAESYFKSKIKGLESLKNELIKWDNLNLVSFINELIEGYNENIKNSKVSQLVEYIDPSLLKCLQEIDLKTEISLVDAFKLYLEDESFKRMISSGYVSYNEGSFVTKTNTPLKFTDVLKNKRILGIKTIPIKEDEKVKYEEYLSSMKKITKEFADKKNVALDECLVQLFAERGWNVADFERETFLSRDIFSKIKNNERNRLKKITIIKLLIGLKPLNIERNFLLELNGTQLSKYNEEDVLYSFILDSKIDIDVADELLRDLGKEGFR